MDLAHAKEFFGQFDSATRTVLLDAGLNDLTEWTERLVEAWQSGDVDGQSRARHSLKGLCENFGAHTLLSHCERDLTDPQSAETLREYRELTFRILREVTLG